MLPYDTLDLFGQDPQQALPQPDPQWSCEGGLYVIWLSPDKKHFYGGRSKNFRGRWDAHLKELLAGVHGNSRFQNTFNKHRFFEPEVLQVLLTREEQTLAEQVWLDENFGKPGCVNLTNSSLGGSFGHTPETCAKMSITRSTRKDLVEKARITLSKNRLFVTREGILRRNRLTGDKLRGRKVSNRQHSRRKTPVLWAFRVLGDEGAANHVTPVATERQLSGIGHFFPVIGGVITGDEGASVFGAFRVLGDERSTNHVATIAAERQPLGSAQVHSVLLGNFKGVRPTYNFYGMFDRASSISEGRLSTREVSLLPAGL